MKKVRLEITVLFVYAGNKSDFLKLKNTISIMADRKSDPKAEINSFVVIFQVG